MSDFLNSGGNGFASLSLSVKKRWTDNAKEEDSQDSDSVAYHSDSCFSTS